MTRRATFTQAEIERAIRAAEKLGKVAVRIPSGFAFVDPETIPHAPTADDSGGNTCDAIFGTGARP